jgi:hypothetical protein
MPRGLIRGGLGGGFAMFKFGTAAVLLFALAGAADALA